MSLLQCPNSGGYKSEKLGSFGGLVGKLVSYVIIISIAVLFGSGFGDPGRGALLIIAFVVCSIDFVLTFRPGKARCKLCGFKWRKNDYTPGRTFALNRDLIERGNARGELEERERRRRELERLRQQQQWNQ